MNHTHREHSGFREVLLVSTCKKKVGLQLEKKSNGAEKLQRITSIFDPKAEK